MPLAFSVERKKIYKKKITSTNKKSIREHIPYLVCAADNHRLAWRIEVKPITDQIQAMNITKEDLIKLTKLTAQQIEEVTCAVCCKYYIAPETAPCGHTLCHTCWHGRLNCASCTKPVQRRSLRYNRPIQDLTEHVHALSDAFEELFNVKVPEILMEAESENNSTNNVREWLASSQNRFSAPVENCELLCREIEQPSDVMHIQKTSNAKGSEKSVNVSKIAQVQDDWDKIEVMPDTEDISKDEENVVGPMDIEPFYIDEDNEYTVANPRRSSRKRDVKPNEDKINEKTLLDDQNSKDPSDENDKKSNKAKQNWSNVKRMRKEFSKLNKKNRSKLNVSIQMCKKSKNTNNLLNRQANNYRYAIDENTPDNCHGKEIAEKNASKVNNNTKFSDSHSNISTNAKDKSVLTSNNNEDIVHDQTNLKAKIDSKNKTFEEHMNPKNTVISPFYKRSFLHPKCIEEKPNDTTMTVKQTHYNVVVDSNTNNASKANDDIEITIKVANTVANIVVKRKNDVQLKINTDREIQTSLVPQDADEKINSVNIDQAQNIVINVGADNKVQFKSNYQTVTTPSEEMLKKDSESCKAEQKKKNTDSADTGTAQFEITDSVEKELSKVMEFEEIEDKQIQTKNNEEFSKNTRSQKSATHPSNLECLNDLDIFDSEPIKETDVQLLKNTEHAASEILLCTVKTRNVTQKVSEKRKNTSDKDLLPKPKKIKKDNGICKSKEIQPQSDTMNYDEIMDTVFANIDAEIETAAQKTQNKNNLIANKNNKIEEGNSAAINDDKWAPEVESPRRIINIQSAQIINKVCDSQKDSENVFSIEATKENENVEVAPSAAVNKMMPLNVPSSNVEDFLTPVISQRTILDGHLMNYDSDKSVVEETPQKSSFTKVKQKSIGAKRDEDQSQKIDLSAKLSSKNNSSVNKNSVINVTDTSQSKNDVTAVQSKPTETPLTLNNFVDQIQHNSTPLARKSLNFDSETVDDVTLCPTSGLAKTTQERDFMIKAFEKTPTAPAVKAQGLRSLALKHKKYVVAGSCLNPAENANLKKLCAIHNWCYVDKYSKELTHLVVHVDDENKAQRTVKYMCALASSIWIVSYEWVQKSLHSKDPIGEEPYEVLDNTGHPGPRRSRIATDKLFRGMSFFCLEPFSVLDVATLKEMVESAGGAVVASARDVRVSEHAAGPAVLLAEPEDTQEDRFIYMALKLSVVPVNYEWVLNCLGAYRLTSLADLLLCPLSILPKAVRSWPRHLLATDEQL